MILRHNTQLNVDSYSALTMVQGMLRNVDIKTTLSATLIHCIKTLVENKHIILSSSDFRLPDQSLPVYKIHNTKLDESLFMELFNVKLLLTSNNLNFTKNDIIQASIYFTYKEMCGGSIGLFFENYDNSTFGAGTDITDLWHIAKWFEFLL